ncbi:CAP domain-containing protein [Geodermatophilus sp. SYSU D00703]
MHHVPAGPPLSSRIVASLGRVVRRILPLLAVVAVVAGVALAVPYVSRVTTTASDEVALDASSSTYGAATEDGSSADGDDAPGGAVVQMGVDGDPSAAPSPAAESPAEDAAPETTEEPAGEATAEEVTAEEAAPSSTAPAAEEAPQAAAEEPADEPAPAERAAAPAAPADPSVEGRVLALVNEARAQAGCAPVAADGALAAVARAHSADMRDRDYFAHDTPEGLSPFDRAEQAGVGYARAENIAFGQPDAAAVMEAWMNSAGHRANVLDCDLTKLGVGVAEGAGGPWWTQLFGA